MQGPTRAFTLRLYGGAHPFAPGAGASKPYYSSGEDGAFGEPCTLMVGQSLRSMEWSCSDGFVRRQVRMQLLNLSYLPICSTRHVEGPTPHV